MKSNAETRRTQRGNAETPARGRPSRRWSVGETLEAIVCALPPQTVQGQPCRAFGRFILLLSALVVVASWASGCATHRVGSAALIVPAGEHDSDAVAHARHTLRGLFPAGYRAMQRAIITVGRRQFTCDGVLTASPEQGHDLALVSNLGVVTTVRVSGDGAATVRQVTPLFREEWARQFVARDLRWLFVPPPEPIVARRLADGRIALQTEPAQDATIAFYVFDTAGRKLESVELARNGRCFWRADVLRHRAFGEVEEVPAEFRVQAESYQLDLRIVGLTLAASGAAKPREAQR